MFMRKRRTGFTLAETLVTVAIIAVLAAVVVPAVTQQLSKGDAPSLQGSISALQTSVTSFVTDVRKFPRRISQLVNAPLAADSALGPYVIGAQGAAAWKGPYATFSLASGDSLSLGMNLKALDSLTNVSNRIQVILSGSTSHTEMLHIDSLIDGASGNAAGNLTWTNTAGVASVLRLFLTSAQ